MKKLLLGLMFLTARAYALDPVTLETDWTPDTYFSSFTSVASYTADIAGLGSLGVSTNTKNVVGFSYSVLSVGADARYTISVTTKTYSRFAQSTSGFNSPAPRDLFGSSPAISTSSVIQALNGRVVSDTWRTLAANPVFTFSSLSSAATTYLWVSFGRQKQP